MKLSFQLLNHIFEKYSEILFLEYGDSHFGATKIVQQSYTLHWEGVDLVPFNIYRALYIFKILQALIRYSSHKPEKSAITFNL